MEAKYFGEANVDESTDYNVFTDSVPITPKTHRDEGSADELKKLFVSSILAPLALTPVGKGVTGALVSVPFLTEEADGGVLIPTAVTTSGLKKIASSAAHVIPVRGGFIQMLDVPTKGVQEDILKLATKELKGIDGLYPLTKSEVSRALSKLSGSVKKLPSYKALNEKEKEVVDSQLQQLATVSIAAERMKGYQTANPGGLGAAYTPSNYIEFGVGDRKRTLSTIVHELNHQAQYNNPATINTLYSDYHSKASYDKRINELLSNIGESRYKYGHELSNLIHPLVRASVGHKGNVVLAVTPAKKYLASLVGTGDLSVKQAKEFEEYLIQKAANTAKVLSERPDLKEGLRQANKTIPPDVRLNLHYDFDNNVDISELYKEVLSYVEQTGKPIQKLDEFTSASKLLKENKE